jgi:hypothetical protein
MIYIATTTINKPTKALKLFAKNNNCKLIVALDKKSKDFINKLPRQEVA